MLPYIEYPKLDLGFYEIGAFPLFVGAAIVVQYLIVMRRAPRHGIDASLATSLVGWAIFLGLVGAHVFDLFAYFPQTLRDEPLELLRLSGSLSSLGGMLGGLLGIAAVMRWKRVGRAQALRFVDCLLFALPFTLALGRAGCALQHDHPGVASTHWLAVAFPDGPRFDLGLLECFYVTALAGVFLALDRRPRPDGFYLGAFFALYAPVRFALDSLRAADARYFGWTPGQYLCVLGFVFGVVILVGVLRPTARAADR